MPPMDVQAAHAEEPGLALRKRGIGSGDGRWMTPAPDELLILEKLREEIFQRVFTRFAAFRHAPQGRIAPPNFIHGPRQMLRDLRVSKFGSLGAALRRQIALWYRIN